MATKATNKKPCNPPTMVTAIGRFAKYLSGIAINSKTRKEMPSAKAIFLNQLNVFIDFIVYVFYAGVDVCKDIRV
jgi:hypothetical protein